MPTPLQILQDRIRNNTSSGIRFDDEADAVWRTFPSVEGEDGKRHGGSPHKVRQTDGVIVDKKPSGEPGELHGVKVNELKGKKWGWAKERQAMKVAPAATPEVKSSDPEPAPEPVNEPAQPEQHPEPAADQPIGDGRRTDVGGVGSGDDRRTGGQGPRILTARPELTKPADPALVPEGLRKHLNEHQIQGAAKAIAAMDEHGGFLLADSTGVGKTRQLLAVGQTYAEKGKKVLIVTKSEVIKPNWEKGEVSGSFLHDSGAMGVNIALNDGTKPLVSGQVNVTTFERIGDLKDQVDGDTVLLLDESHSLKNWQSARAKHGNEMAKKAHAVMYATATPADKPLHLAHLFRAKVFGNRKQSETFEEMGMVQKTINTPHGTVTKWEVNPRVGNAEVMRRISGLQDKMTEEGLMLRRELSFDGVDVGMHHIDLPPEAHEAMDKVESLIDAKGYPPGLRKAAILMHQRRQLEPYKVPATVDAIKKELAEGRDVVVFASRVNESEVGGDEEGDESVGSEGTMKLLREALDGAGVKGVLELHGGITKAKRLKAMDDFQAGKGRVIIATIESGGTGINLDDTTGNRPRTMLMMTAPFSAVENVQAAGRIHRLKTKSDSRIRYIFGDVDVDHWNAKLISDKMKTLGATVSGNIRHLEGSPDVGDLASEHKEPYRWPSLIGGSRGGANDITPRKAGQGYVHSIPMTPQLREMLNGPNRPRWMRLNEYKGKQSVDVWGDNPAQVIERIGHAKSGNIPAVVARPEPPPAPIAPPPLDRTGKIAAVMTPEHKASIHAGLKHLAGMDDDRARELNGKLAEMGDLSDRQAAAGAHMLGKYKRQLPTQIHEHVDDLMKRAGEKEEEEAKQAAAAPAAPIDPNVRVRGNTFPHKEELKRLGFRWDGDLKTWYRPRAGFDPSRLPRGLSHYAAQMENFAAICVRESPSPIARLQARMTENFSTEPSFLEKLNARRNPPRPEPIHRTFADMHVIIENPKGSTRNGTDRRGKKWSQKMNHDYGHLAKTTGADGEGVDAFLGGNEKAPNVHIIHTNDPYTGHYDEDKAMVGFDSPEQAKAAFLSNYDRPDHYRSTTIMPIESFKSALHKGIAGSVRWKRKNKRPLESAAIFSADTPMTPIQKLQHRMRANQVQNFAAEDEAGAEWRTFPSEMESDGKRHGGSPHLIRPSDGMILDEKDGKPGVLHGKTIGQLKERSQAKKADSPAKTPTGRPQPLALAKPREMSSHEQQAHDIMNPGDLVGSTPVVGGKLGTFQPAQPGQQPGQPPAPTHPPLTPEALAEEFKTLHAANKDSRGLPAHTLREHIGQKYGSEAASHEQLDPMLKAMRGKQLRLTSGGHMFNRPEVGAVNQTPEQTAQGIHGAVDPYTGAQETFTHISPQLSPEEQLAEGEKKRTALQQHPHLDLATGQPIPAPPPPPTPVEQQQVAAQTAQHNAPPVAPSPAVGQPLATGEVRPQIPQQTPFPVPPNAPAEAPKTQPTGSASPGMQSPSAPPAPQTQPMVPETAGVNAPDQGMTANPPSTVPPQHHEHIGKMLDLQHKIMDHLAKPAAELAPDDEPWGPSVESTPMGEGRGQAEMDRMGKELAGGAPEQSSASQPAPETTPPAATPAPAPQQASKPTPPVKQPTSEQFNAKRKEYEAKGMPRHKAYDAAVTEIGLPTGSASAQPVKTKPQAPAANVIPAKTAPASATSAPRQSPTLATRDKIAARKKPLQKLQDRMKPKDTRIGSPLSQAHERPYKYPGVDAIYKLDNSSDAPVEMVDPKTLLSHQPYLHSDVASRIKGDIHRPLVIVRHNGKDYIEEGNHRAAHAMREGKHVPAKVIHVGEPPKPKEAPDVGTSVRGESAPEDSAPVAPLPNDAGNEPQGGGSVPVPPAAEPAAPQPASAPAQAGVERSAPRQEDVNQLQARIRDLKEKHATAKSSRIAKSIERDIARNEAELAKMQPTSAPSPRESLDAADKAKTRMDAAVDAVRRFKPSPTNMDEQNRLESEAARAKADFEKSRSSIGSGVLSRVGQSPATETATPPLKPGQLYPGDMTTEEWNERQENQKAGQQQAELKGLAGIQSRIKAAQEREAGAKPAAPDFTPEQQKNMEFERRKWEITEQGAGGASRPAAERAKTYQRQGNSGVTSPTKLNQVGGITAGKPDDSGQHPNAKYLKDQPQPAGVMPEPEVAPTPGVSPGTRSLQKRMKIAKVSPVELEDKIRKHLEANPNAELRDIGKAIGVKPADSGSKNPLKNPLNAALKAMHERGDIEHQASWGGSHNRFKLKGNAAAPEASAEANPATTPQYLEDLSPEQRTALGSNAELHMPSRERGDLPKIWQKTQAEHLDKFKGHKMPNGQRMTDEQIDATRKAESARINKNFPSGKSRDAARIDLGERLTPEERESDSMKREKRQHQKNVELAHEMGLPVPPHVMADYGISDKEATDRMNAAFPEVTEPKNPLDVTPQNMGSTVAKFANEIVRHDPTQSPNNAKALAARRILNAHQQAGDEFRKEQDRKAAAGEPISDAEEEKYGRLGDDYKKLHSALSEYTGHRPNQHTDEHPLANRPWNAEPLEDVQGKRDSVAAENQRKADEAAASRAPKPAPKAPKAPSNPAEPAAPTSPILVPHELSELTNQDMMLRDKHEQAQAKRQAIDEEAHKTLMAPQESGDAKAKADAYDKYMALKKQGEPIGHEIGDLHTQREAIQKRLSAHAEQHTRNRHTAGEQVPLQKLPHDLVTPSELAKRPWWEVQKFHEGLPSHYEGGMNRPHPLASLTDADLKRRQEEDKANAAPPRTDKEVLAKKANKYAPPSEPKRELTKPTTSGAPYGADERKLKEQGKTPPTHTSSVLPIDQAKQTIKDIGRAEGAYADGHQLLKRFASTVPEFALNPKFTVTPGGQLHFKDGGEYTFVPEKLGIVMPKDIKPGDTVGIDPAQIKAMKKGDVVLASRGAPVSVPKDAGYAQRLAEKNRAEWKAPPTPIGALQERMVNARHKESPEEQASYERLARQYNPTATPMFPGMGESDFSADSATPIGRLQERMCRSDLTYA